VDVREQRDGPVLRSLGGGDGDRYGSGDSGHRQSGHASHRVRRQSPLRRPRSSCLQRATVLHRLCCRRRHVRVRQPKSSVLQQLSMHGRNLLHRRHLPVRWSGPALLFGRLQRKPLVHRRHGRRAHLLLRHGSPSVLQRNDMRRRARLPSRCSMRDLRPNQRPLLHR
jgi:hypothetical protein